MPLPVPAGMHCLQSSACIERCPDRLPVRVVCIVESRPARGDWWISTPASASESIPLQASLWRGETPRDVDPPVRPPSSSSSVLIATKAFFPEAGYQRSLQLDDRLRCVYVSAPAVRASGRGDSATVFRLGGHCRTCNAFMLRRIGHVGNKWNCRDWTPQGGGPPASAPRPSARRAQRGAGPPA